MNKLATGLTGTLLVVGSLTACGGGGGDDSGSGGTGDYCADIKTAQEDFDGLDDGDFGSFDQITDRLQTLGDEAPDEIAGDWETFNGAIEDFTGALDDAGLTAEDLSDPAALQELDAEAQQALQEAASSMSGDDVTAATDAIQEHAKSECDVDLEGESGGSDDGGS